MPCDEDCKQAIAKLEAEMNATIDAFTRRQNELYDKMDLTLALVGARTRDSFAQLEAVMRMPPTTKKDEEPPRCH